MILTTDIISNVQEEFEGGNSLSIDWDLTLKKGMRNVLDNCVPPTLKRIVPLYGGLQDGVTRFISPNDIETPVFLRDNIGVKTATYRPVDQFYAKQEPDTFTIEYINGAKFISVRQNINEDSFDVDTMESVGTKTGGTPTLNNHNFISGAGAIDFTATDAGVSLTDTITSIDITEYLKGVALFDMYLPDRDLLASLELQLKTDDTNYYSVTSAVNSIGDFLVTGWNKVKFELASLSSTGSPDSADITKWAIKATTTTGETMVITVDSFKISKFAPVYLEYFSNAPFISGLTGAKWQKTVSFSSGDYVNIEELAEGILLYEMCIIVTQSGTFERVDSQAFNKFQSQLQRKYKRFYEKFPSPELPLSYNISSDIDIGLTEEL